LFPICAAGISKAEAEKLAEKVEKGTLTDTNRMELFRVFRNKRPGKSTLTGYKADIAGAIGRGDTTVETEVDSETSYTAKQTLGKMVSELDQWMKANPNKAEDFEAVQAKKDEILGTHATEDYNDNFFNRMVLPPKPKK